MNIYVLIGIVVWLYLLSVMKRSKLSAFYFILGSVGLFYLLIVFSRPYWVWFLTQLVIKVVDLFGSFANVTEEFSKYSLIVIHSANEQMSLYVDYECSGVIETAAYLGLLTFYPLYNRQEKVFYALLERCGFLQAMLSDYSLLWHLFISAAAMLISSLTRFWVDCSSMDL